LHTFLRGVAYAWGVAEGCRGLQQRVAEGVAEGRRGLQRVAAGVQQGCSAATLGCMMQPSCLGCLATWASLHVNLQPSFNLSHSFRQNSPPTKTLRRARGPAGPGVRSQPTRDPRRRGQPNPVRLLHGLLAGVETVHRTTLTRVPTIPRAHVTSARRLQLRTTQSNTCPASNLAPISDRCMPSARS
jgi:hypothetical protein